MTQRPLDGPQNEKWMDSLMAGWDGECMGQGAWLTPYDSAA